MITDIHTHIIPGIDDGAKDIGMALEMIKISLGDGIDSIIATPHITEQGPSAKAVKNYAYKFTSFCRKKGLDVNIFPGGEIPLLLIPQLKEIITLADSSYVLVELPFHNIPASAPAILSSLQSKGFLPVIAHPERNSAVIKNPETLISILKPGIYTQITTGSLKGDMGYDVKRCAEFLIRKRAVHFMASDAHNNLSRPPGLNHVFGKIKKEKHRKTILRLINNSSFIMENRKLENER